MKYLIITVLIAIILLPPVTGQEIPQVEFSQVDFEDMISNQNVETHFLIGSNAQWNLEKHHVVLELPNISFTSALTDSKYTGNCIIVHCSERIIKTQDITYFGANATKPTETVERIFQVHFLIMATITSTQPYRPLGDGEHMTKIVCKAQWASDNCNQLSLVDASDKYRIYFLKRKPVDKKISSNSFSSKNLDPLTGIATKIINGQKVNGRDYQSMEEYENAQKSNSSEDTNSEDDDLLGSDNDGY